MLKCLSHQVSGNRKSYVDVSRKYRNGKMSLDALFVRNPSVTPISEHLLFLRSTVRSAASFVVRLVPTDVTGSAVRGVGCPLDIHDGSYGGTSQIDKFRNVT